MRDDVAEESQTLQWLPDMPASLTWLLIPAAVTIAMAQDGYNLYKDIQRGKAEELERFITDESYQIDHSALTWPSAGARLQMPNSDKRTMNRFKNLKLQKHGEEEEDSEEEESQPNISEEGDGEQQGTRILIPRTHVMLREESLKSKRGPLLWSVQHASATRAARQALNRDIFWMVKADKSTPLIAAPKPLLLSFERCKVLKSRFREYYQCG